MDCTKGYHGISPFNQPPGQQVNPNESSDTKFNGIRGIPTNKHEIGTLKENSEPLLFSRIGAIRYLRKKLGAEAEITYIGANTIFYIMGGKKYQWLRDVPVSDEDYMPKFFSTHSKPLK